MITTYKLFENVHEKPRNGYYVITDPKSWTESMYDFWRKTLKDRIGIIRKIEGKLLPNLSNEWTFYVWYEGVSDSWYNFTLKDITYCSKSFEDLEKILTQMKFDL